MQSYYKFLILLLLTIEIKNQQSTDSKKIEIKQLQLGILESAVFPAFSDQIQIYTYEFYVSNTVRLMMNNHNDSGNNYPTMYVFPKNSEGRSTSEEWENYFKEKSEEMINTGRYDASLNSNYYMENERSHYFFYTTKLNKLIKNSDCSYLETCMLVVLYKSQPRFFEEVSYDLMILEQDFDHVISPINLNSFYTQIEKNQADSKQYKRQQEPLFLFPAPNFILDLLFLKNQNVTQVFEFEIKEEATEVLLLFDDQHFPSYLHSFTTFENYNPDLLLPKGDSDSNTEKRKNFGEQTEVVMNTQRQHIIGCLKNEHRNCLIRVEVYFQIIMTKKTQNIPSFSIQKIRSVSTLEPFAVNPYNFISCVKLFAKDHPDSEQQYFEIEHITRLLPSGPFFFIVQYPGPSTKKKTLHLSKHLKRHQIFLKNLTGSSISENSAEIEVRTQPFMYEYRAALTGLQTNFVYVSFLSAYSFGNYGTQRLWFKAKAGSDLNTPQILSNYTLTHNQSLVKEIERNEFFFFRARKGNNVINFGKRMKEIRFFVNRCPSLDPGSCVFPSEDLHQYRSQRDIGWKQYVTTPNTDKEELYAVLLSYFSMITTDVDITIKDSYKEVYKAQHSPFTLIIYVQVLSLFFLVLFSYLKYLKRVRREQKILEKQKQTEESQNKELNCQTENLESDNNISKQKEEQQKQKQNPTKKIKNNGFVNKEYVEFHDQQESITDVTSSVQEEQRVDIKL